jgi:hypothetical protein
MSEEDCVARPLQRSTTSQSSATKGPRASKSEKAAVIDKLGFLVRFWELRARHAMLGEPLSAPEQLELLSLMQLVTGDFKMPPAGTCARPPNAIPAQLIGEGTILSVEVRYVCAAAVLVASVKSMTLGERVIVRTADAVSGVEYALPCTVAWAYDASPCIMALAVDGIPTRSDLVTLPDPHVSRDLRVFPIGRQARLVS